MAGVGVASVGGEAKMSSVLCAQVKKSPVRAGMWRAWIRHQSLGQRGRPDLRALSRSYHTARNEGASVLHRVKEMAEAAKTAGSVGRRSSFGLKSKDLGRLRQRLAKQALWWRTHNMDTEERALAVASSLPEAADPNKPLLLPELNTY